MRMSVLRDGRSIRVGSLSVFAVLALLAVGACGDETAAPAPTPTATAKPAGSKTITIGDIEPDEPVKKIARFQPLAEYLAENLRHLGIEQGNVVIARNIEEMGRFMREGIVDVYMDSAYPSLAVQQLSDSKVILRRWKRSDPTYWSTFIALKDSGVDGVEDLVGKVVAFEEPHSTSGFVLPAGTLVQRGYTLTEVVALSSKVAPDEIGYYFTRDEQNTLELVLRGDVAGGGVSNQDYDELPAEVKSRIVNFDSTVQVPRQLVTVRAGMDREIVATMARLMEALGGSEEGRELLVHLKKTKKFDALPPESGAALAELRKLMDLVASN